MIIYRDRGIFFTSDRYYAVSQLIAASTMEVIDGEESPAELEEQLSEAKRRKADSSITKYYVAMPDNLQRGFEKRAMKWSIQSAKPNAELQRETFRDMCHFLNNKVKPIGKDRASTISDTVEAKAVVCTTEMVSGEFLSATMDGWTSRRNQSYFTVTGHYIDDEYNMRSITLGLFDYEGTKTEEDQIAKFSEVLNRFNIPWDHAVCVVTDTEPTMNATGRRIVQTSADHGGVTNHMGCACHLLSLTLNTCAGDAGDETSQFHKNLMAKVCSR